MQGDAFGCGSARSRLAGGVLNVCRKTCDRDPIADIVRRYMQSQRMSEHVDGPVHFRAVLALGSVIASAGAAFRR